MSKKSKLRTKDSKFTDEYVKNKVKQMQEAAEQDDIEYDKWWKTLTPQQQKEHDDDVSRLCDVEL